MKNLKCGSRLALAFGVVIVFIMLICFVGITRLQSQEKAGSETINVVYPKAAATQTLSYLSIDIARVVRNIILRSDEKSLASNKAALDKDIAQMGDLIKVIENGIRTEQERELFKLMTETRAAYLSFTDEVVQLGLANKFDEAVNVLYGEKYKTQGAYLAALKNMVEYQEATMKKSGEELSATSRQAFVIMAALGSLATLIGIGFSFLITRSIVQPLQVAVTTAETVAAGDLTSHITITSNDEMGQLQRALQQMNSNLFKTISQTRSGVELISTAASQIASGNQDLSSRTEQQASSLEETASSMEELTSAVKRNTDNARQANQLAIAASSVATKGGDVVSKVVDTMGSINEASRKIADIISVIDGIAFQTNILALNAAVEAARAGEQGRGFAVVASEVRNLAQRSAAAAKEIKGLIDDSVNKVDDGSKLVSEAGTTMDQIVVSIKRVTEIMAEIAEASQEQSAGIEEVNKAITQMDQVTQQNAALVEEAAAAAEAMQDQAITLAQTVGMFKLDQSASSSLTQAGTRVAALVARERALPAAPRSKRREPRIDVTERQAAQATVDA
ncbi:methyl-accepting chemotaxis protein [Massilia horti]|uniref:HAMP domain-containing protein n=1 Tax=Massilia horti TaxID=2562153 RepID=A0A4Y9T5C3_9BURK|nr:methyl-accepting chemotaxis protein [Massilia horti]TFW35987.1 HAMP domain-containing protein [Massilia horti]